MATKNIEAGLRIVTDVAQALADLRALREEQRKLKSEAASTATGSAGGAGQRPSGTSGDPAAAVRQVSQAERDAAAARRQADREALQAARQLASERRAAARAEAQAIADAAAARRKADRDAENAARALDKTRRQQSARAAQIAPQLTDIVTGLAGGQNPLLVAIQQGGQLRDIYQGWGNAGRALMAVLTPLRLVVGGVATAIGALALAAYQGRSQQDAFNKSLAATGNLAGTSWGQVDTLARGIAARQGESIASVRETVQAMASSGQYSSATLAVAGRAATAFSRATGQSSEEVLRQFAGMKDGVAEWAAKTNQSYNFLTVAEYERIRSLEAQGRSQEAMRLTMEALAGTMESRVLPNLGLLERAWRAVGSAISDAWDALKSIGRDQTVEEKLAEVNERLAKWGNANPAYRANPAAQKEIADLEAAAAAYREQLGRDALRRAEAGIALQAEQDKIKQASKAYQDALANIDAAGAARRLAEQQAALDIEAAAVKRKHAAGISSELAYNLALNSIEQRRLQAQAANIRAQIALEQARVEEKPEDGLAKNARVQQLQAQLAQVSGQITSAGVAAQEIVQADALQRARDAAQAWAAVWQRASDEVRQLASANQAADAAALPAGGARTDAEAAASVAELRRQLEALRRDIQIQIRPELTPEMRAEMERQLAELAEQGARAIDNRTRAARFASLQTQFAELIEAQRLMEDGLAQQGELGATTTEQAEAAKFAARERALPQLRELLRLMQALAATAGDKAAVERATQETNALTDRTTELQAAAREAFKSGFGPMFASIVDGSRSAKEAVGEFVASIARSMLQVIGQRLGERLLESLPPKGGGGGGGGLLSSAFDFLVNLFHTGGVVRGAAHGMTRAVSPLVFAGAERYHTGGIGGLAADEVPAILRKGEEVLTEEDPRHRRNGGRAGGTVSLGGVNIGITIEGAQGPDDRLQDASRSLSATILSVVERWAEEQSRPGGVLYAR